VELEVRVHNLSDAPLSENGGLTWYQYVDPNAPVDSYGHDGPCLLHRREHRPSPGLQDQCGAVDRPDVSWAAYESKYFIAAMVPQNPSLTSMQMSRTAPTLSP